MSLSSPAHCCISRSRSIQRLNRSAGLPRSTRGLTLVEVMMSMLLMTLFMLGFLGTYIQSRRITESSVMHAAVTSMVYGIIEQIKEFDYTTLVPSAVTDANQSTNDAFPGGAPKAAPYIRVRLNQDQVTWLQCLYTTVASGNAPQAPTTTPAATATAASLGVPDNIIGPMPLSSLAGTQSQPLNLHLWVWVDEMPDVTRDVTQAKRVTVVYTYTYNDGARSRTVIDREVFMRTRFDQ